MDQFMPSDANMHVKLNPLNQSIHVQTTFHHKFINLNPPTSNLFQDFTNHFGVSSEVRITMSILFSRQPQWPLSFAFLQHKIMQLVRNGKCNIHSVQEEWKRLSAIFYSFFIYFHVFGGRGAFDQKELKTFI